MEFPYTVRVTKRARRLSIRISQRGLEVVTPRAISNLEAEKIIFSHKDWIASKADKLAQLQQPQIPLTSLSVAGVLYEIVASDEKDGVEINNNRIYLPNKQSLSANETLTKWLKNESKKYLPERVDRVANTHSLDYKRVSVRSQLSRWGSCSTQGNINLNWRLILAPVHVSDYVIVHELAHTKHMDHSKEFWGLVEKCLPSFKLSRRWLKDNGHTLYQVAA